MKDELVGLSDFVWQRTRHRLRGLDDDEYFWEPVPGAWSVRRRGDSAFHPDGVRPAPQPEPFTTIAWRLAHLTRCYGADRNGRFLGVALEPAVLDPGGGCPGTADAALDLLDAAHARWRAHLVAVPAETLAAPLGAVAGPFSEGTRAGFVLHMIDEFIHHGAELALLRDLHRATRAGSALVTGDDLVDAAVRDAGLPAALGDDRTREQAITDHPHAVFSAAAAGRWDLVIALARLGFGLDGRGRAGPLHLAAGAGAVDAARVLVERGADTEAVDPDFGATPLGWATYFGSAEAADYLRSVSEGG